MTALRFPRPANEPVLDYSPSSEEREELKRELDQQWSQPLEIPVIIDGQEIFTGNTYELGSPQDHRHVIARVHMAEKKHIDRAVESCKQAFGDWSEMDLMDRGRVFQRVAELLSGPWRMKLNASTMIGQGKTCHQAEIDAACELVDFLRFNTYYAQKLFLEQPGSPRGSLNQIDYRPLDGFVFAITPFNFTAIAGNLPSAPALMGCTALWKPASTQLHAAYWIMKAFERAGLPRGVINFLPGRGSVLGPVVLDHPDLSGVHFTGSTDVFREIWRTIGGNIARYRSYPRIVGETGGKNFLFVHPSADVQEVVASTVRGAFEYQGQKCSAASRMYLPASLFREVMSALADEISTIKVGDPRDFSNFMGAVIDGDSFHRISSYLDHARQSSDTRIIKGGQAQGDVGWFVQPTLVETTNPGQKLLREEIFGPVLTALSYDDDKYEETLRSCDQCCDYALTGSIFARDRVAIVKATRALCHSAGNFYINDKPTGAVVDQQPFGGGRASGTNDKAGSFLNLLRWSSPRTIKENFSPPRDYRYPFLEEA